MFDKLKQLFQSKEQKPKLKHEIMLKIREIDKTKDYDELIEKDLEELKKIYFNLLAIKKERERKTEQKTKQKATTYKIPKPSKPVIEINKVETKKKQEEIIIEPEIIEDNNTEYEHNHYKKKKSYYEKGVKYEKFVAQHFEKLGYIVKFNGIEKKKKDNSIDLIAIKKDEIILIQCKNWSEKNKYRVTHKDIKAFIGDTHFFVEENPQYKDYKIKRFFVISERILDKSAINYIKEHKNKIRYLLLPFK